MLIGIFVFFGLSFLIIAHEAGHFFAAKYFRLKVDEFGFGFPPRLWGKKRGETTYTVNWLPFGGFVRIAGENDRLSGTGLPEHVPLEERRRIFLFQPAWKRAIIIGAGVLINFLLGWWMLTAVYLIGTPERLMVTGVQESSPAAAVGFQSGDVLLDFKNSEAFIAFVDRNRGTPLTFSVLRNGESLALTATPRTETKPGEGALGVLLGDTGVPRQAFLPALTNSFWHTGELFIYTIASFGTLVVELTTRASIPEGVAGPVGIFSVAQDAGQLGFIYLLQLLALISVNLSVLNLMPFPALDGGRLFLILIEAVKGSPISIRAEAILNGLGFAFLMLFIAVITVHDVLALL